MTQSNDTSAPSVPLAVPVQIQCPGFRCLAYQDEHGTWRDFSTGAAIAGDVQKVSYEFF